MATTTQSVNPDTTEIAIGGYSPMSYFDNGRAEVGMRQNFTQQALGFLGIGFGMTGRRQHQAESQIRRCPGCQFCYSSRIRVNLRLRGRVAACKSAELLEVIFCVRRAENRRFVGTDR